MRRVSHCREMTERPPRRFAISVYLMLAALIAAEAPARGEEPVRETPPTAAKPPTLVKRVEPVFPPAAAAAGGVAEVILSVAVGVTGEVDDIAVVTSGGADFDQAAAAAVRQWTFAPATRDGQAIAARIRVPFSFSAPPPPSTQPASAPSEAEPRVSPSVSPPGPSHATPAIPTKPVATSRTEAVLEATVVGERHPRATTTTEYVVELGKLRVVPRKSAAEQLMLAPGVLTSNHGGEGHAHETFMRGFASKEGQDIEYTVDGVPINDVSNPHGHGYADLYFVPPEFVRSVRITEGPFDPSQGDFAFAGSANFRLGAEKRGARLSYGHGSWNTQRLLLSYAPPDAHPDTFAGFELYQTKGFGPNRAAQRALGLGRHAGGLGSGLTWRLSAFAYATRFDQSGVVRQDDYLAGRMGFYDCYDPNQGGESNRLLLTLDTTSGSADRRLRQVTWAGFRTMRLRANFTGWLTDVTVTPGGQPNVQRGDGLEMRYDSLSAGSRGSYDLSVSYRSLPQMLSLGYAFRFDQGESSQFRLRSVTAIPYLRVFDDKFTILNLAGWLRTQLKPFEWITVRGGIRLDGFSFGVTDLNQPTADREGARDPTQTSQSFGYAINPRVTVDARVVPGLHLVASYGRGTRSTEAAALSDNETAPFARAHVAEGGLAHDLDLASARLRLRSQLSCVLTHVDKDMLFDPVSGRNIFFSSAGSSNPVGPSTRRAVLFSSRLSYAGWLDTLVNVGWARGNLDSTGELLPYIPELVVRLDTGVSGRLFGWGIGQVPVTGRTGLGFTYVPGRPLPYRAKGDDYYLINLGGEIRLRHASLAVELRNLLNLQYRQSELNYASNFQGPEAVLSQRPVRHFTAGEPFFVMATLAVHLEDLLRSSWMPLTEASTSSGMVPTEER
jgi:iron complex outermembrane receptor protein